MTGNLVTAHGIAAAVLYQGIRALLEVSTHEPTSAALRRILLAVLCDGARCRDVADSLRVVPLHASTADALARLVTALECGEIGDVDDRTRRYAARLSAAHAVSAARMLEMPERTGVVHTWLYRYVEVYGIAPIVGEISESTGLREFQVAQYLTALERHGAAANLGGARGWLPTRRP